MKLPAHAARTGQAEYAPVTLNLDPVKGSPMQPFGQNFLMDKQQGRVNIFEETMAHLTYVEIEKAAAERTPILFPVGVIEEHGPHLPLAVDVIEDFVRGQYSPPR